MSDDLEKDIREAVGDPEPDPAIRDEVLRAIEGDAQAAAPRARRWPLLAAPAAAAALVLAVLLSGGPAEHAAGEPPAPALQEPEPIASVLSEDGRFQLDLMRLETSPAEGDARRAKLMFRARLVRDDPDLFLAHGDPVSKVVTPDGEDRTPESHSLYDFPFLGRFGAHDLDLGPAPERLKLLELSVKLLRLRSEPVEILVPAGEQTSKIVAPFDLLFTPEPVVFSIGIGMTDESLRGYPDGLPEHPSRGFYDSIVVTDADGAELMCYGGMGTGGGVVRMYHRMRFPEGNLPMETLPIAYPVTIRIRDPRPVETIPAVFRFEDLPLPPLAPGPLSDWGEWSKGLRMRVRRPLSVEQGERLPVSAEIDHDPARLPAEAERLVTIEWPAFLALRITPADGGEERVLRPDLVQGPPSPGPDDAPDRLDPLDGTPVPILPVEFPLARLRDELAPGDYTARVEYTFPGPEDRWPFFGEHEAAGCWRGTVASAPFAFEIRPETEHRRVYVLPKKLVLGPGEHGPVVKFPDENDLLEEIRPVIPNGWYVGARIIRDRELWTVFAPVEFQSGSVVDGIKVVEGPLDRTYRIEIFRTLDPAGSHWGMGPVEIVATRELRIRATAEEIEALRKEDR